MLNLGYTVITSVSHHGKLFHIIRIRVRSCYLARGEIEQVTSLSKVLTLISILSPDNYPLWVRSTTTASCGCTMARLQLVCLPYLLTPSPSLQLAASVVCLALPYFLNDCIKVGEFLGYESKSNVAILKLSFATFCTFTCNIFTCNINKYVHQNLRGSGFFLCVI